MYRSMDDRKEHELKALVPVLRSLVTSRKQPCLLSTVLNDYREMENKHLPYRYFKFNEPVDLFTYTGEFLISERSGQVYISTKTNDKSKHIAQLVKDQKVAKKKARFSQAPVKWQNNVTNSYSYQRQYQQNTAQNYSQYSYQQQNTFGNDMYSNPLVNTIQNILLSQKQEMERILHQEFDLQVQSILVSEMKKQEQNMQIKFEKENSELKNKLLGELKDFKKHYDKANENKDKRIDDLRKQNTALREELNKLKTRLEQLELNKSAIENADENNVSRLESLDYQFKEFDNKYKAQLEEMQNHLKHLTSDTKSNISKQIMKAKINNPTFQPESEVESCSLSNKEVKQNANLSENDLRHQLNRNRIERSKLPSSTALAQEDSVHSLNENYVGRQHEQGEKQNSNPQKDAHKPYQFNPNLDPCMSIAEYCAANNYREPCYSVFRLKNGFDCKLELNSNMIYTIYPKSCATESLARQQCALNAIQHIQELEKRKLLPEFPASNEELLDTLLNELINHPHGLISNKMSDWFANKFSYKIPENWFELIRNSGRFTIENGIKDDTFIILANRNAKQCTDHVESLDFFKPLKLPWSESYWRIYITSCISIAEIYGCLIRYENLVSLSKLSDRIKKHMHLDKKLPEAFLPQNFYLVKVDSNWHRVQVETLEKDRALCFFIDCGHKKYLPMEKLYFCDSKFLSLPPQAIKFFLFGLENCFGSSHELGIIEKHLLNRSFVANVVTGEKYYKQNKSIKVILMDKSNGENIDFNKLIQEKITSRGK